MTTVEMTCERINESTAFAMYKGRNWDRLILDAQVTKCNGGIDQCLWITLQDGQQRIAYASEIFFS